MYYQMFREFGANVFHRPCFGFIGQIIGGDTVNDKVRGDSGFFQNEPYSWDT